MIYCVYMAVSQVNKKALLIGDSEIGFQSKPALIHYSRAICVCLQFSGNTLMSLKPAVFVFIVS